MKLDVKIQLLNFCFEVFNFIFLALGSSVLGFGLWVLFDGGSLLTFNASDELRIMGAGLMLIGLVVLGVSLVGIVGAVREIRVLLLVYMGFLLLLVLGQLFVTLLLLLNRDKIKRSLDEAVDQIIFHYGGPDSSPLMDRIQTSEGCCGKTGPSDWLQNAFIQSLNRTDLDLLPCSCFNTSRPAAGSSWCSELLNLTELYGAGPGSYEQGCKVKVTDWLQENVLTIIGMDVALMLVQVLQVVLTVSLCRTLGRRAAVRKADRLSGPEEEPDREQQNYAYVDPDDGDGGLAHPAHHHDYRDHD